MFAVSVGGDVSVGDVSAGVEFGSEGELSGEEGASGGGLEAPSDGGSGDGTTMAISLESVDRFTQKPKLADP